MPPLHALSVTVLPESEDAAAELLLRRTGESAVVTQSRVTGLSTATVFLPRLPGPAAALRRELKAGLAAIAECGLALGPARVALRRVKPEDWRESWKRHFRPLAVGRALLVRPSWSRRRPAPGQAELVLDPGLSFGTGQHPTTEFCLRELVRLRPSPAREGRRATRVSRKGSAKPSGGASAARGATGLLDVGTGSGVLALAAAKLGYGPVIAFDFDPEAVEVARANARRNRVARQVQPTRRDVARLSLRPTRRYAVVCANLTADLLQRQAARLVAQVVRGGHLVLAGILAEEFPVVRRVFESFGLELVRTARRREWQSGSFVDRRTGASASCRRAGVPPASEVERNHGRGGKEGSVGGGGMAVAEASRAGNARSGRDGRAPAARGSGTRNSEMPPRRT
jgi:ribosomal protein L11 methyltransferase